MNFESIASSWPGDRHSWPGGTSPARLGSARAIRRHLLGYDPVLLGKLPFEGPQHRLRRADDVLRPTLPQGREVVVAHHAPTHNPDTVERPVLTFQRFNTALYGQGIVHAAGEDLVAQREALLGDDQANADLRPIASGVT